MKRERTRRLGKRIAALMTAMVLMVMTALPAMAGDQVETYQSPYGITYTVNYTQGSADIAGKHIYFGFTPESTYVKIGGWRWACGIKASELAGLAVIDPEWFEWATRNCLTVEEYYRWRAGK